MAGVLRIIGMLLVVLTGVLLHGPLAAEGHEFLTLRFIGPDPLQRLFMPKMGELFFEQTEIHVDVVKGSAQQGLQAVLSGEADLTGLDRPLTDVEKAQGLVAHTLGWDALAVVVHRDNPLAGLEMETLRGIMSGRITRWQDCGGADLPVVVVACPRGSRVRGLVRELVLAEEPLLRRAVVSAIVDQADNHVAMFPGGIALLGATMVDNPKVKVLLIEGAAPVVTALASERYPLTKPLSLVTRGEPRNELAVLVDLARGSVGKSIFAEHFIPRLQE